MSEEEPKTFHFQNSLGKRVMAGLFIHKHGGERVNYSVDTETNDAEHKVKHKVAFIKRLAASRNNDPITQNVRRSDNPDRTFRALARLHRIVNLGRMPKQDKNE